MKISKKLISAIVMLTLSFVMLVTSSFAWFSMNTNVKATGMTVSAKADQLFLQIVKANNGAGFNDTEALVEVIVNSEKEEMAPVTAANSATDDDPDTLENERALTPLAETDKVLAADDVKWFISTSDSPDSSTAKVDYVDVTSAIADDSQTYWLINSFDIRLNPAAGLTTAANPLTCSVALSQSSTDDIAKAVSVLVVCGDNAMLFKQGDLNSWTTIGKKLTAGAFSNPVAGYVKVDVYVFFDGENVNCKTNNVTTNSYGVDVYFSVANAVA